MGKIHIWSLSERKLLRTIDAARFTPMKEDKRVDFGGVRALAVSPDGSTILAGGLHKASNPLGAVHEPLLMRFDFATGELRKSHIAEGIPVASCELRIPIGWDRGRRQRWIQRWTSVVLERGKRKGHPSIRLRISLAISIFIPTVARSHSHHDIIFASRTCMRANLACQLAVPMPYRK